MTGVQGLGLALAYLIGAIPIGLIVGLLMGTDVRRIGSGNIGATNVLRALGPKIGLPVFLADVLKGVAGVAIGRAFGMDGWLLSMCALFVVLGHCYSIFMGFEGGKGVASALGTVIMLEPAAAAIALGFFLLVVLPTRLVSLGSIVGAVVLPVAFYALNAHVPEAVVPLAAMSLIVVGRHHENIARLLKGEEHRFGSPKRSETSAAPTEEA